jgi:hypothetical protein
MISFAQQAYDDDAASSERQRNAIAQAVVSPRILSLERDQNWSKLTTIENESRRVKYCWNAHHSTNPSQLSHHAAHDRDAGKETTDAAEFHLVSPRHRAKSTAIPRKTHLTRCGATIAVPSADRRDFSANKRIQHERRTQHGGGTSRIRGKVASCRSRGSRQQRPRQGQGTFHPSPAARAECK